MKQNKFYLLAAATALLLSACNNEEVPGTQESDLARFTGSIEGVKTRAYDTTWENGDQIGITGTSGWETYTNMFPLCHGDGQQVRTGSGVQLHPLHEQAVLYSEGGCGCDIG